MFGGILVCKAKKGRLLVRSEKRKESKGHCLF